MPLARRHNRDEYLAYGFTTILEKGKIMPQCVLCGRVFSAFSLKPSKMMRHMECRHQDVKNKPISFFIEQRDKIPLHGVSEAASYSPPAISSIKVATPPDSTSPSEANEALPLRKLPVGATHSISSAKGTRLASVQELARIVSYKASLKIVQAKGRHSLGEELLMPSLVDACSLLLGLDQLQTVQSIDLSEAAVDRQVVEMSLDLKQQTLEAISKSVLFALQLDETTDVIKGEHLLVYIRYLSDQTMDEDFLFCDTLSCDTCSEDIVGRLDEFFAREGLTWLNCVAISTSGSPIMRDLRGLCLAKNPNILVMHSTLSRQLFTSHALGVDFGALLEDLVDMVAFVKNQGFENALYEQLRESLDEDSRHLFVSSNSRWICVQFLDRLFELRDDLVDFLEDHKNRLADRLKDVHWLARLCFIRDVYQHVDELLRLLADCVSNVIEISEIVCKFRLRVHAWVESLVVEEAATWAADFPKLTAFMQQQQGNPKFHRASLLVTCKDHLDKLQVELHDYMIDPRHNTWIRSPLTVSTLDVPEQSIGMKLDLLDMRSNQATLIEHEMKSFSLLEFWIRRLNSYPSASLEALRVLLAFPTQDLSEAGFQALTDLPAGERLRPNIEHDLRLIMSSRMPRFQLLAETGYEENGEPSALTANGTAGMVNSSVVEHRPSLANENGRQATAISGLPASLFTGGHALPNGLVTQLRTVSNGGQTANVPPLFQ